jgi:hypothetical protein
MKRQVILMRFTAGAAEVHLEGVEHTDPLEMSPMDNPTAVAGGSSLTIPGAGGGGAGGNITGAGPWPTIYICWW